MADYDDWGDYGGTEHNIPRKACRYFQCLVESMVFEYTNCKT